MERLGGGDLCYNALNRHKNSTKGDCMDSQRVLTIDLRYGGLGDQLFWSHIPRIAKDRTNKGGGYDKVYVRLHSPSRDAQYIKLIWESNPYVDGVVEIQDTTSDTTESSPIDSQKQNLESSFSDSKQLTESTTSKNLCEALPNINNSACASTSRAESKDSQSLDSAIFAEQKSNQYVGALAPTAPRPLRGVQSLEQGGSSASATIALEAEKRGTLPVCRAEGLQAKRSKNSGGFFGALASGEGITPLFAKKQSDFENLGNIRENTTLRNRESTESSVDSESKTFTESSAEILKNEKTQNLGGAESKTFTESSHIDSEASAESKADSQSKAFTESTPTDSQTQSQDSNNTESKARIESKARAHSTTSHNATHTSAPNPLAGGQLPTLQTLHTLKIHTPNAYGITACYAHSEFVARPHAKNSHNSYNPQNSPSSPNPHNSHSSHNLQNPHSPHTSALTPPHIDYIMFLDSDDYWVEDCLLECVRASDGADVVWFEYQAVFDAEVSPRAFRTHLQAFGYERAEVISNLDWARRAIDRGIDFCSTSAWQVCIDFGFFRARNLSFLNGVKSEDTLFSLYLFSLARRIVILPKVSYCYYIRGGSINDFSKTHTIATLPPYLRAMCPCYDDVKELQEYYQLASYFLMLERFLLFLEDLREREGELSALLYRAFVPLLVRMSLGLIDFPKDPLRLIPRLPILKPISPKICAQIPFAIA